MVKRFLGFSTRAIDKIQGARDRGDKAMRERNWRKAITNYEIYLKGNPSDTAILVQLGHASKEAGLKSKAIDAYRKAVESNPEDSDARFHLISLNRSSSDPIKNDSLTDLSRSSPMAEVETNNFTDLESGDRARDERRWSQAAIYYSKHLNNKTEDAGIWLQLGHMLKESGRFEHALYAYEVAKLKETSPSDVNVHIASLMVRMGKVSEAKPLWAEMFLKNEGAFFLQDRLN